MSFKALPFSERAKKNALSEKYKVNGIPTLVFLNPDGLLLQRKEEKLDDKNKYSN